MDNTLTYMDQSSFLALRALGRQPLIQFVWIYDRAVDLDGLRRFQRNLGHGLLGRHIETSPLPFGRHRWVAEPGPADLAVSAVDRPRDEVWSWADERVRVPVDPEWGPAWHLGVVSLTDGGSAVSLVVSHSVSDAMGLCGAIADASTGQRRDFGYPRPGSRTAASGFTQDLAATLRSVPETARAVAATARLARTAREDVASSMKSSAPQINSHKGSRGGANREVVAPTATAWVELEQWDRRAASLGGTSNSLFAGVACRLAAATGRVDPDGRVQLSWPVSDRVAGDTRANALTAATVSADTAMVTTSLAGLRSEMKTALTALPQTSEELLAPLPLAPLTPRALARRLEMMVGKIGDPVGCSNLGELDPAVNRPDGSDADRMAFRMLEPRITAKILDRTRGYLYLGSGRVNGRIFISVGGWVPGGVNTEDQLRVALQTALADMELSGEVD